MHRECCTFPAPCLSDDSPDARACTKTHGVKSTKSAAWTANSLFNGFRDPLAPEIVWHHPELVCMQTVDFPAAYAGAHASGHVCNAVAEEPGNQKATGAQRVLLPAAFIGSCHRGNDGRRPALSWDGCSGRSASLSSCVRVYGSMLVSHCSPRQPSSLYFNLLIWL